MNTEQIRLVQSTFAAYVAPLGDIAADVFYQNLFALDESLRTLFKNDMQAQGRKLLKTLAFAVDGLREPNDILAVVRQLGQRHMGYGVLPAHYDTVGKALIQTLQTAIGPALTPEVRDAWAAAYEFLSTTMQSAVPDYA